MNNLKQLWTMQLFYSIQFGGREKKMPTATGSDFWLELTKTQPPLIDVQEMDILVCPLSGKKPMPGFTTYRGPKKPVAELGPEDPVGCCEPGNHPSKTVCVLLKDGSVHEVGPKDPLYGKAAAGTSGAAKK
jgi:hypothetical protein